MPRLAPATVPGFRLRGPQPTRVDAFVDAAFAFAVTLLVISVGQMPTSVGDLWRALRGVPAFALSFYVIARVWLSHRRWTLCYGLEDGHTVRLSLLLVFVILLYVYPLRLLFSLMFSGWSGGWLAEQPVVLHGYGELRAAYLIFGIGYAAIALLMGLLYRHAWQLADALELDATERALTSAVMQRWFVMIAVPATSIVLALGIPMRDGHPLEPTAPGLPYLVIAVVRAVYARREARTLAAAAAESPGGGA
jgi:uncharacterized membrane protein